MITLPFPPGLDMLHITRLTEVSWWVIAGPGVQSVLGFVFKRGGIVTLGIVVSVENRKVRCTSHIFFFLIIRDICLNKIYMLCMCSYPPLT